MAIVLLAADRAPVTESAPSVVAPETDRVAEEIEVVLVIAFAVKAPLRTPLAADRAPTTERDPRVVAPETDRVAEEIEVVLASEFETRAPAKVPLAAERAPEKVAVVPVRPPLSVITWLTNEVLRITVPLLIEAEVSAPLRVIAVPATSPVNVAAVLLSISAVRAPEKVAVVPVSAPVDIPVNVLTPAFTVPMVAPLVTTSELVVVAPLTMSEVRVPSEVIVVCAAVCTKP